MFVARVAPDCGDPFATSAGNRRSQQLNGSSEYERPWQTLRPRGSDGERQQEPEQQQQHLSWYCHGRLVFGFGEEETFRYSGG